MDGWGWDVVDVVVFAVVVMVVRSFQCGLQVGKRVREEEDDVVDVLLVLVFFEVCRLELEPY